MKKWAIVTDSCSDLSKEFRDKYQIPYAKMMINWEDEQGEHHEEYASLDWDKLSSKEFYDIIRKGIRIYTSQTPISNYIETFSPFLEKGIDVLYLACSSGLSASLNQAILLADGELKEKYPDAKLVVVDSLRAGMSLGIYAQKLKDEGKSLEEVQRIIEEEKLTYKEIGIPETLTYLKRAGRVKASTAFMGNLISLKPILVFDDKGVNLAVEKAIGKKKAFTRMAEIIRDDIADKSEDTYLMHADASTYDVEGFKKAIEEIAGVKNIIIQPLGPIIGASSGPGTLIFNYRSKTK